MKKEICKQCEMKEPCKALLDSLDIESLKSAIEECPLKTIGKIQNGK